MTAPELPPGDVAFYDDYQTSIDDGIYRIEAKTEIEGVETGTYFDDPITQRFEIRGPQFSIPSSAIHSVYPPGQSNSIYGQNLANVVISRRVLPWERRMDANDPAMPWLCLLAFREGEIPLDTKTNQTIKTNKVSALLAPKGDVVKPDIPVSGIPEQVLGSTCAHIQITAPIFQALAPKLAELRYLSHVREVNMSNQAFMQLDESGWFSVVAGNRLLATEGNRGTRYFVHLVSLEGYFALMNDPASWPKKESDPAQDKDIALVSLYNWTFLSQPQPLDFRQLVENFANQAGGDADNLLLRRKVDPPEPPIDPPTQQTLDRLNHGYVPRTYRAPSGEQTYAWYRGPLCPVIAQQLPRPTPDYHYPSASSLMIYDKAAGVFDQSYAAAWSIGRAMALSDSTFGTALIRFRKSAYRLLVRLMDALDAVGDNTPADLAAIVKSSAVRDAFRKAVNTDLGGQIAKLPQAASGVPARRADAGVAEPDPVAVAKAFLAEPAVTEFLKEKVASDLLPVAEGLARSRLLYDVPFNHLVPDQKALPVEAMRFFYVDQNWLDALTDGAISVGMQSSKDSFFTQAMRGVLDEAVAAEVALLRSRLLGQAVGEHEGNDPREAMSGVLIRSAVVSGWPGLQIKGFKGDPTSGTALKLLRMDRLASNVVLALFLDVPDTVMLAEPQQGLAFGVEDGMVVSLRQLADPPGRPLGKDMPAVFRTTGGQLGDTVLNVNDGAAAMVPTMQSAPYLGAAIGPAQFGMQMIRSPEAITFVAPANQGAGK